MREIPLNLSVIFCIVLSGAFLKVDAQDIHFTLFDMTPLNFNPAETGKFHGTYRIHGIFRDQYAAVIGDFNEYKTPSLSADLPVIQGFRKQDWVGVGLTLYNDVAGSLKMSRGAVTLSAAYHLGLGKRSNSTLSLGYQTGSVRLHLKDQGKAVFEDNIDGGTSADEDILAMDASWVEHGGGLHFRSTINETDELNLGISVSHIGEPRASLLMGGGNTGGVVRIDMRYLATASYRTVITDRLAIRPVLLYQQLGKASEIQLQARGEYLLNPEKGMVLHGGAGMRFGDALQLMVGMDIKDLRVMLAYDLTTSSLSSVTGGFGGIELAVRYIGKIYKRPEPDPAVFCPRF